MPDRKYDFLYKLRLDCYNLTSPSELLSTPAIPLSSLSFDSLSSLERHLSEANSNICFSFFIVVTSEKS